VNMRRANTLVGGVIVGFLFGMLVIYGITRLLDPPKIGDLLDSPDSPSNFEKGAPAPDFELVSLSGESIRLSDLRGQIVLINFWATWCGPCEVEMPTLQARFEQYAADLVILAVNPQDSRADMLAYVGDLGLTFEVLMDTDNAVFRKYFVSGFPSSYLVDREGILRVQHVGLMTADQFDHYLAEVGLGEKQ